MPEEKCPHCGYKPAIVRVVGGAVVGGTAAAVGVAVPPLGAAVLIGLAGRAVYNYFRTDVTCFNCGKKYPKPT
jgi:hypothetical protein